MASATQISWAHHTFNAWRGCEEVSPACAHCYARDRYSVRNPMIFGTWGSAEKGGTRVIAAESTWEEPLKWNRWAIAGTCWKCGGKKQKFNNLELTPCDVCFGSGKIEGGSYRARVFALSLGDVFEDFSGPMMSANGNRIWFNGGSASNSPLPSDPEMVTRYATMNDFRERLFDLIEQTPQLDWLLLTKRPQNVMQMVPSHWQPVFPPNVWMGVTTENQKQFDERVPLLVKIPARVRFLSCEPLLEVIHTGKYVYYRGLPDNMVPPCGIHWIISGGESGGASSRITPIEAHQNLRLACVNAEIPFHFKQHGDWIHFSQIDRIQAKHVQRCETRENYFRLGANKSGNLLDGNLWQGVPW